MKKSLLLGILAVLVLALVGFIAWGESPLPATPVAQAALQTSSDVAVSTTENWTVLQPAGRQPGTGFIFYPGGRVDYRAYAPLLRAIASQGYLVVLVPMPLNLAVFGVEEAQKVIESYPQVQHWAIGGHSLGGSMAAQFVINHPGKMAGLVLWASYPGSDMSNIPIQVVSISGSQDGLSTPEKIEENRKLQPASTRYVVIPGGNHAQFGSYGAQPGDGTATISPSAQWEQTVKATVDLLKQISG